MKSLLTGLAVLITILNVQSQNNLSGKISARENGNPIPGATVYINDLKKGTVTDSTGNYILNNLPSGIFLVEFRFLGYQTEILKITINGSTAFDISLEESHTELKDVLITGVSAASEKQINPVPSVTIDAKKIAEISSVNLVDALTQIPGVNQISTGNGISKPVIRGLGFNRVLVLQNNIRQEGQQWGDEHGLEIDEYSVGKVEIIKGPGSLAYGSDAMAGVIHFLSPDPIERNKHRIQLNSSFQTNQQLQNHSLSYEGNKNDYYWNIQGSRKIAGNYSNKYDGKVFNSGFESWNGSGMLGMSKKWGYMNIFFSSFNQQVGIITGERDSLGNFTEHVQINDSTYAEQTVAEDELTGYQIHKPYQKINHQKIILNGKIFKGLSAFQYTLGFQSNRRQEFEESNAGHEGHAHGEEASIHQLLNTFNYDLNYHFHFKEWETTTGVNGYLQNGINEGEEYIIPEYNLNDLGVYLITQRSLKKWHFSGGIRYNIRSLSTMDLFLNSFNYETSSTDTNATQKFFAFNKNYQSFAFSGGTSYKIKEKLIAKANISSGFRAPNLAELGSNGAHHGTFRYEVGNQNLNPESSIQADLSLSGDGKHITVELAAFSNTIKNYIFNRKILNVNGTDSIITTGDEANRVFIFTQEDAQLLGGEITVDIHPHPFDWLHIENSFSFVQGELKNQTDSTRYLPFMPAPRLQTELRAHMHETKGKIANGYIFIQSNYSFSQERIFSAYNTETITPSYLLLNAGLGFDFLNKRNQILFSFIFNVQNIGDVAYQNHLNRLKYTAVNEITGRQGVFNQGRNFNFKLNIPVSFSNHSKK